MAEHKWLQYGEICSGQNKWSRDNAGLRHKEAWSPAERMHTLSWDRKKYFSGGEDSRPAGGLQREEEIDITFKRGYEKRRDE